MTPDYQDSTAAKQFSQFIQSKDGKIQQAVLKQAILAELINANISDVLEIGCGTGWLLPELTTETNTVYASDISPTLLSEAKEKNPSVIFSQNNIVKSLPFPNKQFETVIANMVLHDCDNQTEALKNIYTQTKENGTVIITIPNPYYTFPVATWKRNILSFLLQQKPQLYVQPYTTLKNKSRLFFWKKHIPGYFYTLSEQLEAILKTGFTLHCFKELESKIDSPVFDLHYRLFRYPIFLLLVLKKTSKKI